MQLVTEFDVWGSEALQIAASGGEANIAMRLSKAGSRLDALDKIGKSPVDCLLKADQDLQSDQHTDGAASKENEDPTDEQDDKKREGDNICAENKRNIFVELALKRPDYHDGEGRTFLDRAAQETDYDTISKLLQGHPVDAQDLESRTPLHYAIIASRTEVALALSLVGGIDGEGTPGA
ncbi:hypothetical protein EDB81DRAFT_888842 [Dactylonectria macrodidyma]|uniref:Ankyrin repeat protein n=1 Tax=Dactylonectria macrodidyma TaxID=307937 RepID=A0A9P9DZ63_9HYPO|nr:hypothetical protein EDB81DRAFT_888842 [Dactylonectria macrodidyma]